MAPSPAIELVVCEFVLPKVRNLDSWISKSAMPLGPGQVAPNAKTIALVVRDRDIDKALLGIPPHDLLLSMAILVYR